MTFPNTTPNTEPRGNTMAGYKSVPDDQWSADDLARAEAAHDSKAINDARRAGNLQDLLNTPTPEPTDH